MRIARAMALAGIDSRRKCEIHVKNGAVTVNGEVVRDLGRQVNPGKDAILFRGRMLQFHKDVYYILNKPAGYTTTTDDPYAEKTVFDLLPSALITGSHQPRASRTRVFSVGRLDRDSEGLLLFTNDGELANRLMHPRYQVGKWYEVKLSRAFAPADKTALMQGVRLEDGIASVKQIHACSQRVIRVLVHEGKKREIRRIFEALDYKVLRLIRIAMGPLTLRGLLPGRGRYLTLLEIAQLKQLTTSAPA